jgi:hypothetical protein
LAWLQEEDNASEVNGAAASAKIERVRNGHVTMEVLKGTLEDGAATSLKHASERTDNNRGGPVVR